MKQFCPLFSLIIIFILAGCATATPYQRWGSSGGYYDVKLQEGVYKVNFGGNGWTSSERASNFALLHAAEVALQNGYNLFAVVNEKDISEHTTYTTPVRAQTSGIVLPPPPTPYGMIPPPSLYSGTTHYSGGETTNIDKPKSELVIQCFCEHPSNFSGLIYDARQVQQNLRNQYGLGMNPLMQFQSKCIYQNVNSQPSPVNSSLNNE